MEIMDKYVHAGEALAERENDVRHLSKQVPEIYSSRYSILRRSVGPISLRYNTQIPSLALWKNNDRFHCLSGPGTTPCSNKSICSLCISFSQKSRCTRCGTAVYVPAQDAMAMRLSKRVTAVVLPSRERCYCVSAQSLRAF